MRLSSPCARQSVAPGRYQDTHTGATYRRSRALQGAPSPTTWFTVAITTSPSSAAPHRGCTTAHPTPKNNDRAQGSCCTRTFHTDARADRPYWHEIACPEPAPPALAPGGPGSCACGVRVGVVAPRRRSPNPARIKAMTLTLVAEVLVLHALRDRDEEEDHREQHGVATYFSPVSRAVVPSSKVAVAVAFSLAACSRSGFLYCGITPGPDGAPGSTNGLV